MNSEVSTSGVCSDEVSSLYSLCRFVTLPRRFRLGIVSGEEVSSSQNETFIVDYTYLLIVLHC